MGTAHGVQSVTRALDLLQHVADGGGRVGVSDLAGASGLPPSTVHRMLRSLVAGGYLRQEPDRRYRLGLRLATLGDAAIRPLAPWLAGLLDGLVRATGETANAATLAGDAVVFVAQSPSPHAMRTCTEVGRRTLPHCSAVGKVLLAGLAERDARALLARTGTPARTPRTRTGPAAVLAELDRVRAAGYAVDDEEEETGARCVAVPVPGVADVAVSVSGPTARITPDRVPGLAALLAEAVRR